MCAAPRAVRGAPRASSGKFSFPALGLTVQQAMRSDGGPRGDPGPRDGAPETSKRCRRIPSPAWRGGAGRLVHRGAAAARGGLFLSPHRRRRRLDGAARATEAEFNAYLQRTADEAKTWLVSGSGEMFVTTPVFSSPIAEGAAPVPAPAAGDNGGGGTVPAAVSAPEPHSFFPNVDAAGMLSFLNEATRTMVAVSEQQRNESAPQRRERERTGPATSRWARVKLAASTSFGQLATSLFGHGTPGPEPDSDTDL